LETAAFGAAADLVERPEHGAAERRGRVIAPPWKLGFSPEVEPVDVAVREIHRPLMRLVVVFTRDVACHRESARHHGALRAAKGEEIRLRGGRIEVIGGKGASPDHDVDVVAIACQLYGFLSAKS